MADDFKGSTETNAFVFVGARAKAGKIEIKGDSDWFRIILQAGSTYRFDLQGKATGPGTLVDPELRLRDASGAVLLSNDNGPGTLDALIASFTAPTTGLYFLSAEEHLNNAVGTYRISASLLDDYLGTTATTAGLGIGAKGRLEVPGDADWFRVGLAAGVTYQFDLIGSDDGTSTLADPLLRLLDDAGTELALDNDGGEGTSARIAFTPTTTGIYYLSAEALGGAGRGSYVVLKSAPDATDDFPDTTLTGASIAIGGTLLGNHEDANDYDVFRVQLVKGTKYKFDLEGLATGQGTIENPFLELLSPDGEKLAADLPSSGIAGIGEIIFTATRSGAHFLSSNGLAGAAADVDKTYRLTASAFLAGDDWIGSRVTNGALAVGGQASGIIEIPFDTDWFRIELAAGTTYRFDVEGAANNQGTLVDPAVRVHDAAGVQLAFDDDGGAGLNPSLLFTAPTSGKYFVNAASVSNGVNFNGIGAYRISATIADDFTALVTTSGRVNLDASGNGTAAGSLEAAGDIDWFRLNLVAGTNYRFTIPGSATSLTTLANPVLGIHDADGIELAVDDDSGAGLGALIGFTPTQSGTYFLAARAADGLGTGTYRVSSGVFNPADDFAFGGLDNGFITIGGRTVFGAIETVSDVDVFEVNLVAGATYRFDLQGSANGQGSLSDPTLTLTDRLGTPVAFDDDSGFGENAAIASFKAPTSGIYFLQARSGGGGDIRGGSDTGTYRLTAAELPIAGYSISPGEVTVGEAAGTATFTVNRFGAFPAETLFVNTLAAARSNDFAFNNGDIVKKTDTPLSFAAGQTTATVTVTILDNGSAESDESFGLIVQRSAADPAATFLARSTLKIIDDDRVPNISVEGKGSKLIDGDTTPSKADGTDLGTIRLGTLDQLNLIVRNDGTAPLSFGALAVPLGFTVVTPLVAVLAPGKVAGFTVEVDTGTLGLRSGVISIFSNDPDASPFDFAVRANVVAVTPEIAVESNGLLVLDNDKTPSPANNTDFGNVTQGTTAARDFVIRNLGDGPLTVSGIIAPAGFVAANESFVVLPGASRAITVTLGTAQIGPRSGVFTIVNDDNNEGLYDFALSANVIPVGPEITVRRGNIDIADGDAVPGLGAIAQGTLVGRQFIVSNQGTATLTLGVPTLPAGFTLIEPLAASLAPGASDSFSVQLDTSTLGSLGGLISIATNDADENPFDFAVSADIVPAAPEIRVVGSGAVPILDGDATPATLDGTDFGTVSLGSVVERSFTIFNDGATPLVISELQRPAGFSFLTVIEDPIAPGAFATFRVLISTSAPGSFSGEIRISSNDADENPFNFTIRGTVAPPSSGLSPMGAEGLAGAGPSAGAGPLAGVMPGDLFGPAADDGAVGGELPVAGSLAAMTMFYPSSDLAFYSVLA